MGKQPWQMTPIQLHAHLRAEALRAYPDISATEYDEFYTVKSHLTEWYAAIDQACRSGEVIPAIVIDRMCEIGGEDSTLRYFRGVYEKCKPEGYWAPSVREREAQSRRDHPLMWHDSRNWGRLKLLEK